MTAVDTPGTHGGTLTDLPADTYHASAGLSHSGARHILTSPARYRWEQEHPTPPTDAMEEGTAFHALVLEGQAAHVVVEGGRGVTERKEAARAQGLVPLSADRAAVVEAMAQAVAAHPDAAQVLKLAPEREVSAYATDPDTGITIRCRYDALGVRYAVDLKKTRSITEFDDGRPLVTYGYAMQAAWYLTVADLLGQPRDAFLFVLCEPEPPHFVAVRELDDTALTYGRRLMRRAIDTYHACTTADHWPGPVPFTTISVPAWALRREDM